MAKVVANAGAIVLAAFVAPYREDRERMKSLLAPAELVEVHVATPREVCEARDPKGLYANARKGEVRGFTGVDAPYEAPLAPDLSVGGAAEDVDACARAIVAHLESRGVLAATSTHVHNASSRKGQS